MGECFTAKERTMTFEEASIQNEPELAWLLVQEVEGLLEEAVAPGAGCALLLDGQPVFIGGLASRISNARSLSIRMRSSTSIA